MGLFRDSREIAIWAMQAMAEHRQVWRSREKNVELQRKGGSWERLLGTKVHWREGSIQAFSLAELAAEKSCPPPAGLGSKVGFSSFCSLQPRTRVVHESAPFWPPDSILIFFNYLFLFKFSLPILPSVQSPILNEVSFIEFQNSNRTENSGPRLLSSSGFTTSVLFNVFLARMCLRL